MKKILLTGGTGLIGSRLAEMLEALGCEVHILTRSKRPSAGRRKYFTWSVEQGTVEDGAVEVDTVIHLAGAGVADKRWTAARKREIRDSRVESTALLHRELRARGQGVKSLVSASAVGYYGDGGDRILHEEAAPGSGFLPETCVEWERAAFAIGEDLGIPVAALRTGIVLSTRGGALPQLDLPVRFGISGILGSGKQYMPWIHIDDLCRMYLHAAEHRLEGPYNAAAPDPATNREVMRAVAASLNRPFIPMPAPGLALKAIMGEMAGMLLEGQRTSADKIMETGFGFDHPDLDETLADLYRRKA